MLKTRSFLCFAALLGSIVCQGWPHVPSVAIAAEPEKEGGQKDQEKSSDRSGPLQPIREAVRGLERAASEEPPKAIQNIKEGFRKRFNASKDQPKDK